MVAASLGGAGLVLFFGWMLGGLVLGLGLLLAVMGLRDDVRHLSALVRLSVQVAVCAGFLIALDDLPSISFSDDLKLEHAWVLMGLLLLVRRMVDQLIQLHGWHRRHCGSASDIYVVGWGCFVSVGKRRGDVKSNLDVDAIYCGGYGRLSTAQLATVQDFHGRCGKHMASVYVVCTGIAFCSGWLVELHNLASAFSTFCNRCDHYATHANSSQRALVRSTLLPRLSALNKADR